MNTKLSESQSLLIDIEARMRLSRYLASFRKPAEVTSHEWLALSRGVMASVEFRLLGLLVDSLGNNVLNILRWPNPDSADNRERQNKKYARLVERR